MDTFFVIIAIILGILISISLHELGHFIPAKLFKTYVSQYFVGFGPKIWSKKVGETEYGIKAIPLGGHTTIEGMFPWEKESKTAKTRIGKYFAEIISSARDESKSGMERHNVQEKRAFYNLSTPKKLTIMLGGTFTNFFVGLFCIIIAFTLIGAPAATNDVNILQDSALSNTLARNYEHPSEIEIVGVNDKVFDTWDWGEIVDSISNSDESPIRIRYIENGDTTQIKEVLVEPKGDKGSYKIGIQSIAQNRTYSVSESFFKTLETTSATIAAIGSIPVGLFNSAKLLIFGGQRDQNSLVSIVGLGQVAVATDKNIDNPLQKIANLLAIIGSLNIALFVFNLIPLLPLDGGHTANAIFEGVCRLKARILKKPRPLPSDLAKTMPIAYIVFVLLIVMFVIIALLDIIHPII